jgi:carbonic anhydrase
VTFISRNIKTKTALAASPFLALLLLAACQDSSNAAPEQDKAPEASEEKSAPSEKSEKPNWTYEGDNGAENWAELSDSFATCATGRLQSPFNIEADITADLADLGLNYNPVAMNVINNGHTIQVDQAGAGQLVVDGKTYDLLQFHFHAGSEYTISGKDYPLEVHLVHASADGALAVVGVMFEEGAANDELGNIWANMPAEKGGNLVDGQMVDVANLLPSDHKYFRFMGSLTTPPCTEGVNWHMMATPITASADQIEAFKAIYPMNARPLQDENNRLVVIDK